VKRWSSARGVARFERKKTTWGGKARHGQHIKRSRYDFQARVFGGQHTLRRKVFSDPP